MENGCYKVFHYFQFSEGNLWPKSILKGEFLRIGIVNWIRLEGIRNWPSTRFGASKDGIGSDGSIFFATCAASDNFTLCWPTNAIDSLMSVGEREAWAVTCRSWDQRLCCLTANPGAWDIKWLEVNQGFKCFSERHSKTVQTIILFIIKMSAIFGCLEEHKVTCKWQSIQC